MLKPVYSDAVRYCRWIARRQAADEAEDILQNSLLKGLEKFKSLNDESKFKQWLFTIITREYYSSVRRNFWGKFLALNTGAVPDDFPEIYDRRAGYDDSNLISVALTGLSKKEKTAILLFELGGFSIEEIRDIESEKSLSAVKSRLSRARGKMRKIIENDDSGKKLNKSITKNTPDAESETLRIISAAAAAKERGING